MKLYALLFKKEIDKFIGKPVCTGNVNYADNQFTAAIYTI